MKNPQKGSCALVSIVAILLLIGVGIYIYLMRKPVSTLKTDYAVASSTQNIFQAIDLNSFLSSEEKTQLLASARAHVQANSVEGLSFDLIPVKHVGNWIMFEVVPKNTKDTDVAQLFMEKKNGVWKGGAFGTSFPDLASEHPELF